MRAVKMALAGLPSDAIEIRFVESPSVRGSETELVQIVLNLLVNAIQACPEDCRVKAEVEIEPAEGGVVVRVLDRGPGISPSQIEYVFDPFYTTKEPGSGTGLGLSVSYDLAQRHGGRLEASNRPGGGAVFTLWLPASPEPSKPAAR